MSDEALRSDRGRAALALLARMLGVPEGSGGRALRMLSMIFALSSALVLMKAAQSGLFLAAYSREAIPWAFAASAVTLATASSVAVVMAPRLGTARLARVALVVGGVAMVTLFVALHASEARPLRFLTYVVIEATSGVLVIQVWSVASAATDARSARKLMPIAGIGAGLAWTLFGTLVRPLGHALGAESLLLIAPLLIAGCFFLVRAIERYDLGDGSVGRRGPRDTRALVATFREGFRFVAEDRLMRLLTALSLLGLICEQLMDLHLMGVARAEYPDAESISAFFGTYYATTSFISLFLLAGAAGRLLAALGATGSLVFFPASIALLALVAAFFPGLGTAVLLRGAARVLKQSLWSSSTEQLQTPLSGVRRSQARSAIRGVISPGGYAVTAVCLGLLPSGVDPRWIAGLAFLVATTMVVIITTRARKTYARALHRAVDERSWEIGAPRVRAAATVDPAMFEAFAEEIRGNDAERASLAAEILASTDGRRSSEALALGLSHESADVRLTAARGLASGGVHALDALLLHSQPAAEPEAQVRAACVAALRRAATEITEEDPRWPSIQSHLERLTNDPDPEVAAAAHVGAIALAKRGEARGQALLPLLRGELPAEMRVEDESAARAALLGEALRALDAGAMDAVGLQSQLSWILERGDVEARLEAAFAIVRTATTSLVPDVVRLLKDPFTAPQAARALVDLRLPKDDGSASGPDTLAASLSRLAHRIAHEPDASPAAALVLRLLDHNDPDIRRAATHALGMSIQEARHPPLTAAEVLPMVKRDAAPAFLGYSILAGIAQDDGVPDWDVEERFAPIAHELELRIEAARQDVLALLLLRGQRRLVSAVRVARRRPSPGRDARLAELLEIGLAPEFVPWIVPLFERLSLRERVDAALRVGACDESAREDPLYAIVALGDDLLTGVARLCYGERFRERFDGAIDETMLPLLEKMSFLRSVPLFGELAGQDLRRLAEMVDTVEFGANELVFAEGETGDALYVVLEGEVVMCQGEVEIARLGAQEFFGELALLDSQPRSTDARCLTNTRLIRLRGADLDELLTQRPAATREILRVVVGRLRDTVRRVTS